MLEQARLAVQPLEVPLYLQPTVDRTSSSARENSDHIMCTLGTVIHRLRLIA